MQDQQPRRAGPPGQIVVVGMHRSGTSATAGLLHACGAHVGGPGEIKTPSRVNPRGFFERWDVRAVCDAALEAAGAAWWKVSAFKLDTIAPSVRQELSARAADVVAGLDRHPVWVMKDPRLCLALPVFREHLAEGAVAVIVARHPLEVARSLEHRDGFPLAVGLALWEAYVTAGLRNTAGMAQVVVSYSKLVQDPSKAGRKLVARLTRAGVVGLTEPDFTQAIDPCLRHHRAEEQVDGGMSAVQRELWTGLCSGETGQESARLSDPARRILEDFEAEQRRKAADQAGAPT